jgi:hypothetical protein
MVRLLAANLWINPKRGGNNSMKKYTLIAAVLVFSVFNLVGAFTQPAGANGGLRCQNLGGCAYFAPSCRGTSSGCTINCQDGGTIFCPLE